jgi:hypothetical protein
MSAKLVPTFADRGYRVVSATDPHGRILGFLDSKPLLFHSSSSSVITHEAEWTPFQNHYFSENLVVPGIESGSVARNSDHKTIEAVRYKLTW